MELTLHGKPTYLTVNEMLGETQLLNKSGKLHL
jgi:hypothetical protein